MAPQTINIRKLQQASQARHYLLEKLSPERPSTFDTLVHARNDFSTGSFFSALPDSMDLSKIEHLAWWLPDIDTESSIALLAQVIRDFLSSPRHVVLLHDYIHWPSDAGWKDLDFDSIAAFHGEELYLKLTHSDIANHRIHNVVSAWAPYFPYTGCFYASPSFERTEILSNAELDSVASNLRGVVVDAFDGHSFVLWWRDDLRRLPILQDA